MLLNHDRVLFVYTTSGELVIVIGTQIQPIMEPICIHLSNLWQTTDVHSPVRASVLLTLTQIVRCSGMASDGLHQIMHPLLSSVYSNEQMSFLRGEASLLWYVVVVLGL